MQSDTHLVWMDMEMTGLEPERDTILEIATLITTNELQMVAEGPVCAIHQSPAVLDAMDEWNRTHHGASGLSARVIASTTSLAQAEAHTTPVRRTGYEYAADRRRDVRIQCQRGAEVFDAAVRLHDEHPPRGDDLRFWNRQLT